MRFGARSLRVTPASRRRRNSPPSDFAAHPAETGFSHRSSPARRESDELYLIRTTSSPATSAASASAISRSQPVPTASPRWRSSTTCFPPRASSPATRSRAARPASGVTPACCQFQRAFSPTFPSASRRWSMPAAWASASARPAFTSRMTRCASRRSASRTAWLRLRWPTRRSSVSRRLAARPLATWPTQWPRRPHAWA